MTFYINGNVGTTPSSSIEGVTALGSDIDLTSTGLSVTITGNDAGDTINFETAANGGIMLLSNYTSAFTTASVAASGGTLNVNITTTNIAGLGLKGIQVSKIQLTPSTDTDDWTAEVFRADTFTGEKDFSLDNVTTSAAAAVAEEVKQVMNFVDADASSEVHLKLTNDDPANAVTFDVEIEFAPLN